MTYEAALEYLYSSLPMFTRIGAAAYKKDLHNSIALCDALGNPQQLFKSIHVAGTNGKGSTSHMLAAILQAAGYKTGLYTSPHIKDFGERIRVNGTMINQQFVIQFVGEHKALYERIEPSFFELTVAMAFDYFAKEQVDVAVIETGLGGRLDSTNIISPVLSVITNIGYDHMNLLGNTLKEIAHEKAGIIKANTPVVIGETLEETAPVFTQKAKSEKASITFAANKYRLSRKPASGKYTAIHSGNKTSIELQPDLRGIYQERNIRTVLAAVDELVQLGFSVSKEHIQTGIANTRTLTGLRGRWDIISQHPTVIHDVAHNEDGLKMALLQLQQDYPGSKWHFVMGFVKDKDVPHVLGLFPKNCHYYFTQAHIPRALPANELQSLALSIGLQGEYYDHVNEAIYAAKEKAAPTDVVLVCGSFFVIAEISD